MYSIVQIGNHQYQVRPGDIIDVQKLKNEEGQEIELDQVLFVGGDKPLIGRPVVDGAKVKAKIIRQARDRKVTVFKRKPGLWQKKRGHRQPYTALLITEISSSAGQASLDASHQNAKKYLSK